MAGAMKEPYPQTYYSVSTALPEPSLPLRGQTDTDICVVGGGIAGCSAALALAERGYRVLLLEARRVGWGASGRNGGQVLPGIALDQQALERLAGPGDAGRIWALTQAALTLLKDRLQRHEIDCDWVPGHLTAAVKPRHWEALQRWHEELGRRYDYAGTRLLQREALRAALNSARYVGALADDNAGHLHPLRYTLGLAQAAQQRGVRIYEGSRVMHHTRTRDGAALQVHTAEGSVRCAQLLFAGGGWLGATVPALARTLLTITASMVATEPLGEATVRSLIPSNAAVSDTNWVLDYFHRTPDHRLLFGGALSYSGLSLRSIGRANQRRLLRVFPELRGAQMQYAWDCRVDLTANRTPHFGRIEPDVFFVQGFSGHGLALAGLAGVLVAEAIAGSAERFDVFARLPHQAFPGGQNLRQPLLALAMLWHRLRDLL
jgi:gamma-glutamylputrescine oxidase